MVEGVVCHRLRAEPGEGGSSIAISVIGIGEDAAGGVLGGLDADEIAARLVSEGVPADALAWAVSWCDMPSPCIASRRLWRRPSRLTAGPVLRLKSLPHMGFLCAEGEAQARRAACPRLHSPIEAVTYTLAGRPSSMTTSALCLMG